MTVPLRVAPKSAIPSSFMVVNAGRSETFALGEDFTTVGMTHHLTLRGVNKVIALKLWSRPESMKGGAGCPEVAELFTRASGTVATGPEAAPSVPTTTPVSSSPAALPPPRPAAAVIAPAVAPALMTQPQPPLAAADAPDVVAARVNGQRSSAGAEDARVKFGWDPIIAKVNSEARAHGRRR